MPSLWIRSWWTMRPNRRARKRTRCADGEEHGADQEAGEATVDAGAEVAGAEAEDVAGHADSNCNPCIHACNIS